MRGISIGLILPFGLVASAQAADTVEIAKPPSLAKDVEAMPVIAAPADDAQRRINGAVKRLDDKVRKAIAQCKKDAADSGDGPAAGSSWKRSVDVAMRGPRFLSYRITDDTFCGGAHPNTSTMAIVYDLTSGQPVDWTKLLPKALTGNVALAEGADGTKMVTLSSTKLHALYLAEYRRPAGQKKDPDDEACREALSSSDGEPPAMMVWLDAARPGLTVQYDVPHAVESCADAVTIPAATLQALGAQPLLLDALKAAHEAEAGGTAPR